MKRLLVGALLSAALFVGCLEDEVPNADGSKTQIDVDDLRVVAYDAEHDRCFTARLSDGSYQSLSDLREVPIDACAPHRRPVQ